MYEQTGLERSNSNPGNHTGNFAESKHHSIMSAYLKISSQVCKTGFRFVPIVEVLNTVHCSFHRVTEN